MFPAFLKMMGITTGIAWGLIVVPLYYLANPVIVWGALVGCILSAACFTAGFYTICRSFQRSFRVLMITIFGGMLARLVLIGTIFILLVNLTPLHVTSFLVSLLGFYVVYLIIELHFVHSKLHRREERSK
jgi:uncharacterized membrane protein YbhN (UPF0104 family)